MCLVYQFGKKKHLPHHVFHGVWAKQLVCDA